MRLRLPRADHARARRRLRGPPERPGQLRLVRSGLRCQPWTRSAAAGCVNRRVRRTTRPSARTESCVNLEPRRGQLRDLRQRVRRGEPRAAADSLPVCQNSLSSCAPACASARSQRSEPLRRLRPRVLATRPAPAASAPASPGRSLCGSLCAATAHRPRQLRRLRAHLWRHRPVLHQWLLLAVLRAKSICARMGCADT